MESEEKNNKLKEAKQDQGQLCPLSYLHYEIKNGTISFQLRADFD